MAFAEAQLSYLVDLGMRPDADDATSESFSRGLTDTERAEFESLAEESVTRDALVPESEDSPETDGVQRTEDQPSADAAADTVQRDSTAGDDSDVESRIQRALRERDQQRRQRMDYINRQAGTDIPRELVERAMREEWDQPRVDREFLAIVRNRPAPVGHDGHVGIHTRSHDRDCTLQALQGGLLLREGIELDDQMFARREASAMLRRSNCNAGWLHRAGVALSGGGTLPGEIERSLDMAHQYQSMSLIDICRESLRLSGRQVPHDRDDVIQRAVSTAVLSTIFSTSVNMQILQAYLGYEDSTRGWIYESEVADFKNNERGRLTKGTGLEKLRRGAEAAHITYGDATESYVISRYAGQFSVDEQDIIDDRFGGIQDHTPRELGELAAEIRPNLVYSILLGNPNMRDSVALFHADHGNLEAAAALAAATLETARANMATQTENGRVIQNRMRYLVVPENLLFTARQLISSAELYQTGGAATSGTANPHQGAFQIVSDPRLDDGVTDPDSGTTHAGSTTTWFGAAAGGRNTIEVGYRRGTGRAPRMDTFMLTGGRWGMGWKCNIDIGAKATDWRGLHKSTA